MKSKDLKTVLRGVQLVAQQLVLNEVRHAHRVLRCWY